MHTWCTCKKRHPCTSAVEKQLIDWWQIIENLSMGLCVKNHHERWAILLCISVMLPSGKPEAYLSREYQHICIIRGTWSNTIK
jgi:hypothetical protein